MRGPQLAPAAVAAPTGPPSPAPVCCSSAPILPAVHSCGGAVCALRVWWSFMSGRSVAILTRWLSGFLGPDRQTSFFSISSDASPNLHLAIFEGADANSAADFLKKCGRHGASAPACRRCAHRPTLSSPCLLLFCPHSSCCALLWGRRVCTASLVEFYVGPLCGHLDQMAVGWGFEALIGRHLFFQSPQMPLQTCTWPFSRVPMPILQPISSKSVGDMVPAPPPAVAAPTGPPSPAPVCCSSAPILPAVHSMQP